MYLSISSFCRPVFFRSVLESELERAAMPDRTAAPSSRACTTTERASTREPSRAPLNWHYGTAMGSPSVTSLPSSTSSTTSSARSTRTTPRRRRRRHRRHRRCQEPAEVQLRQHPDLLSARSLRAPTIFILLSNSVRKGRLVIFLVALLCEASTVALRKYLE